ncbi:hypothetical protein N7470_001447 [Penicillium chermesinum]|nr:hypothetical protein N7470_001447 [Penicillium chermesinum]
MPRRHPLQPLHTNNDLEDPPSVNLMSVVTLTLVLTETVRPTRTYTIAVNPPGEATPVHSITPQTPVVSLTKMINGPQGPQTSAAEEKMTNGSGNSSPISTSPVATESVQSPSKTSIASTETPVPHHSKYREWPRPFFFCSYTIARELQPLYQPVASVVDVELTHLDLLYLIVYIHLCLRVKFI